MDLESDLNFLTVCPPAKKPFIYPIAGATAPAITLKGELYAKKISVLCTTFLLPLLMTVLAFAADSSFSDVAPDAPYAESIAYLVEHGITNGTGADTFSPDAPVTVRQWSVMLCRAYGLPIEGDTWEEMSYVAMVEAYSHGWMYSSIFSAPETQMCRGALYDSAFAAAGIPIYDNTLYDREALSAYENTLRIAGEFQLCDSGSNPQKIVTRAETARLLHAILTRDLTVEAPTVPVKLKNPTDINANDFLLELQKVPEAILAEFNQRGWAYSIDFDRVAQFAEELNVSCIGVTDYAAKTIYVSEASATVHEFGHFLDKVLGFPAEHERLFCEEAESSILRDYAKTNAHEYFADCFVYWIMYNESAKRMERFKQSAPQTYAYFESLTAIEDLSKQPPWGNDISEDITNLSNYFVTSDGEDFLTILLHALEKAKDVNEDVNIESM